MQTSVERDLVYFLHIPKTSGTSLRESFLQVYGPDAASPNLLWDDLVNGTSPLSETHRLISGHFGGFLPLWLKRWPRIVTVLRDPIGRALSHINHIDREKTHPLHSLASGLTVDEYCEHPLLRRTVDNFQARYLASLDFALALIPRNLNGRGSAPYGTISVRFENALYSLDKETGLLEGAVGALNAIDAVGICEAHRTSLQVFARALGWKVKAPEFQLNRHSGQPTVDDLSSAEIDALTNLNLIDLQVYRHAVQRFARECRQYGLALTEDERSALTQPMTPAPSGR